MTNTFQVTKAYFKSSSVNPFSCGFLDTVTLLPLDFKEAITPFQPA